MKINDAMNNDKQVFQSREDTKEVKRRNQILRETNLLEDMSKDRETNEILELVFNSGHVNKEKIEKRITLSK